MDSSFLFDFEMSIHLHRALYVKKMTMANNYYQILYLLFRFIIKKKEIRVRTKIRITNVFTIAMCGRAPLFLCDNRANKQLKSN